jgi:hypothetical protein
MEAGFYHVPAGIFPRRPNGGMMTRSTMLAPQSVARGALRSRDRAAAGCPDRANTVGAPTARCGVASSCGRHCSALRGPPQSVARGALRSGDRAAAGMPRPHKYCWGAYSPLWGRIFLRTTLLRPIQSQSYRRTCAEPIQRLLDYPLLPASRYAAERAVRTAARLQ